MVKGCQRKTIHIKETGSRYFEEAYFILKAGIDESEDKCGEMIDEAMRIVGESLAVVSGKKKHRRRGYRSLVIFGAGSLSGALIFFLVWVLMFTLSL